MFYELIFENGSYSIAEYADDDEARRAVETHHNRAKNGEIGGPAGNPAERIFKVLKYNKHPQDFTESQAVEVSDIRDAVDKAINDKAVGNLVSVPEVAAAIRDVSSSTVISGPHESNYKMPEVGELTFDA